METVRRLSVTLMDRPGSAGSSTSTSSSSGSRKSILKKETFIDVHDDLDRAMASASNGETPEQFFQRVLATHVMSPLDLCDRFCFNDARKHRHVSLKHVCEVLFELDGHSGDPMTEAMEAFLYQFAFDGGDGEIVVDIKEALRTLDIWKTTAPTSPSKSSAISAPGSTVSPAKAAILEVKAEKLKQVIDSLQQQNLRLSRALSSSTHKSSEGSFVDETRPPSPLRIAVKKPLQDATAASSSLKPSSPSKQQQQPQQPSPPRVVSRHERELIALANRLEYAGVKKLEALLRDSDTTHAGFVSLKQLRWLLANECRMDDKATGTSDVVSESKLMELCLGMNFNAQGQLDYSEFIRVLLDILVYESRPRRQSSSRSTTTTSTTNTRDQDTAHTQLSKADTALLAKVQAYVRSFDGERDKSRALLSAVCDKYDLEGNQWLSITETVRALHTDLPSRHPVRLPFPLTQHETRQLVLALAASTRSDESHADAFVYYPTILDALARPDVDVAARASPAVLARVLSREFWTSLRSALCPHDDPKLERKIHAQLCKILQKLDPTHTFQIARRHFVRVFDQHWSARDLEMLGEVLSHPLDGRTRLEGTPSVRYDVLMRLLFGAPELRDASVLARITTTLCQGPSRQRWHDELSKRVHTTSGTRHGKTLSYQEVYELLCGDRDSTVLNTTEFLYLVAHIQHETGHRVDVQTLWTLLSTDDNATGGKTSAAAASTTARESFTVLRRCLRVLCDDHGLEQVLARLCRHEQGVVRFDELAHTLSAQLRVLSLSPHDRERVHDDTIHAFLDSLTQGPSDGKSNDNGETTTPGSDLLYPHALLDAVFDWDAFTSALQLPDRLVDVKKTLELFDWDHDGTIDVDDWAKAWRVLTRRPHRGDKHGPPPSAPQPLHDWAMRVLVSRFPAQTPSEKRARRSTSATALGAIDYSRLLVFVLEGQQRVAREQLQAAVLLLLQETCDRVTHGKRHVTTSDLESAFETIDRDGKGYFHIGDLRTYVLTQLKEKSDTGMAVETLRSYASQGPALESVMSFLVGGDHEDARKPHGVSHSHKQVVSLMRFQALVNHGFFQWHETTTTPTHGRPRSGASRSGRRRSHSTSSSLCADGDDTSSADEEAHHDGHDPRHGRGRGREPSSPVAVEGQITRLCDLEQCIYEIAKPFVDAQGHLSPATAYAHLNGATSSPSKHHQRRPRSQSPVRTASSSSSSFSSPSRPFSSSSRRASGPMPRSIADAAAGAYDPLTASRLKQTLRRVHGIETSTHLVGQFFLRLGATTKHFLELSLFAQWLVPLRVELQHRVKQMTREMLAKSKCGGGHVDLERFIGAVERRLVDAQVTADAMAGSRMARHAKSDTAMAVHTVRPSVLLTQLHQLNVSVRTTELMQLLRHFGMETQHEIDFAVFLRRLYELAQQLPSVVHHR